MRSEKSTQKSGDIDHAATHIVGMPTIAELRRRILMRQRRQHQLKRQK